VKSSTSEPGGGGYAARGSKQSSGAKSGASSGASHGGGGPDQRGEDPKVILKGTEKISYRDAEDHIRPALLDDEARKAAIELEKISTTQLRRFFEQVVTIKRRLELDHAIPDAEILAQVAFLKASAAYAAGRDRNNAPVLKFLVKHSNTIQTKRDFLDFHRHFEAVVAFHKVYGKDKKGN
jgi:CRISPR-associated protein Csm2